MYQLVVLNKVFQVVLQLISNTQGIGIGLQHGTEVNKVARAAQSQHERHLEGWHGLVTEDVHHEVHVDGRLVPHQFLALPPA